MNKDLQGSALHWASSLDFTPVGHLLETSKQMVTALCVCVVPICGCICVCRCTYLHVNGGWTVILQVPSTLLFEVKSPGLVRLASQRAPAILLSPSPQF